MPVLLHLLDYVAKYSDSLFSYGVYGVEVQTLLMRINIGWFWGIDDGF